MDMGNGSMMMMQVRNLFYHHAGRKNKSFLVFFCFFFCFCHTLLKYAWAQMHSISQAASRRATHTRMPHDMSDVAYVNYAYSVILQCAVYASVRVLYTQRILTEK